MISTDLGDLYGGQELSLEAVSYFDEKNPQLHAYLLSIYNNLGITSYSLKQYPKAIEFYNKSLQFISDSSHTRIVKNNIANAYRKTGNMKRALEIYKSILSREQESINHARILSNYAYTRWLANASYNPEPDLREALRSRLIEGDLSEQNSSYVQLADYYMKKSPDSALLYATKLYQGANSVQDQMEALQKLIPLSQPENSKKYFNRYRILEDSIQNARNSAKNQFAMVRYETEKHKADNLLLQNTNTIRYIWIISLAFVIVTGSIISILWYKRRERSLALKAANAVRESQLKTSKKVHDVVANGLYRLMSETENNAQLDRDKMLDDLETLYEKSRDISYDDAAVETGDDFPTIFGQLLTSFATATTKVLIVGNTEDIWMSLGIQAKTELKYVVQELMVNMTKHSGASSVAIRFEKKEDTIMIYYTDNGVGIPDLTIFKNGLTNTGNRINSIGGNITFGKGTTGGLNVQIQIPVSQ